MGFYDLPLRSQFPHGPPDLIPRGVVPIGSPVWFGINLVSIRTQFGIGFKLFGFKPELTSIYFGTGFRLIWNESN